MKTSAHQCSAGIDRLSRREIKNLRYAEARHRYELHDEAEILQYHLAEFWDERFEKKSNIRIPLPERLGDDDTPTQQIEFEDMN